VEIIATPPLLVKRGSSKALNLVAFDPDTDPHRIHYFVDIPPAHGYLENTRWGTTSPHGFSQEDVDDGHVLYHAFADSAALVDRMDFSVRDGDGGVQVGNLYVTISPIPNQAPVIVNGDEYAVLSGGAEGYSEVVTTSQLLVTDDEAPSNIHFRFNFDPSTFRLLIHGVEGRDFTQQDVNDGNVVFEYRPGSAPDSLGLEWWQSWVGSVYVKMRDEDGAEDAFWLSFKYDVPD
jgi:hypothetical protein